MKVARRAGRRRARVFLLPALALLLGALSPFAAAPARAQPTDLQVAAGDRSLDLSWTAPAGAVTGYDVHYTRSTAAAGAAASGDDPTLGWVAASRRGTAASQSIAGLRPYVAYRVRVRSTNAGGTSPWAHGRGTPFNAMSASLSASTRRPAEPSTVTLTVTLSEPAPPGGVRFTLFVYARGSNPAYVGDKPTLYHHDVSPFSGGFSIEAGKQRSTHILAVWEDDEPEGDETFTVKLEPDWDYVGEWPKIEMTIPANDGGRSGGAPPGTGGGPPGGSEDDDDDPSGCTLAAPYWSGPSGGFTVRPAEGRASVSATCGRTTTEYTAENGLVTRLLSGACPGGLRIEGAAPGGWYWQHGERNAAAAPFVCSEALGGPPAVVPGGVQAKATDDGTWFRHDAARLVGIVPHLAGNDCAEYVTPYWQGDGGVVVRPAEGRTSVKVRIQCGGTFSTTTLSAGEDGVVAALVRRDWCTDSEGEPKQGRLTVTGAAPGGWYWIDGERNAAVAPLMCADLLGGPAAVRPGGVRSRATDDGTLFSHEADRLIGVVPHVGTDREDN